MEISDETLFIDKEITKNSGKIAMDIIKFSENVKNDQINRGYCLIMSVARVIGFVVESSLSSDKNRKILLKEIFDQSQKHIDEIKKLKLGDKK